LDCLHTFTIKHDIDILALTKLTACDQLEYKDCLPAKMHGWWEANQWSVSHNKQDTHRDDFQPSRTAIVMMNKISHKMTKPGDDTLGRWCWTRLREKENHFLCIVSLYRPCKAEGQLTTYQQQVRWFSRQGKNVGPQDQILQDLKAQIEQWQSEGDMVIILTDISKDIREELILSTFRQMGLTETMLAQHGNQGPNTHNQGKMPINGIFIPTNLIQTVQSGYLAFGEGIPSDHRAIWIEVPLAALGWFNVPESVPL